MRAGEGVGTADLDRLVSEATENIAQNLIALAYSLPRGELQSVLRILAVVDSLDGGASRTSKVMAGKDIDLLALDRGLFESDIEDSAFLEIGASMLLLPYKALAGDEYLARCGRSYRKRKIKESITGIVWDHPELSRELLIDPRYFVDDISKNVSHLVPELARIPAGCEGDALLEGFRGVLADLEDEGVIRFVGSDHMALERGFTDAVSKRGVLQADALLRTQNQLSNLMKLGLKSLTDLLQPLVGSVVEGFASATSSDRLSPDRFLFFPTAAGLSPLSSSIGLDEIVDRIAAPGKAENIKMRRIGSALNEVFLVDYEVGGEARRVLLKRYPTWVSLKWAPLALWTLGTQNFAVLGRSRMERECATTGLLGRMNIDVPRILYTSFRDRLLVREFVEGVSLTGVARASFRRGELEENEASLLGRVGGIVAAVHGSGHTLGDCKPDNFIVTPDGDPFVVDLEQGARGGSPAWDVAEFLHFSGHYAGVLDLLSGVAEFTRSFIRGYLAGGGERRHVAEASELRYTRVFAPLTMPQVIYTIAKICQEEAVERGQPH